MKRINTDKDLGVCYLYNIGKYIHTEINGVHVIHEGPYYLTEVIRVNKVSNGVIYVDTKISTNEGPIIEDDYIDLNDVYKALDASYRNELINSIRKVEIIHRS